MTKYVTRLVPTVNAMNASFNGTLHVGHLYCLLVNIAEARNSGGKFGIRFDDSQRYWNWYCGEDAVNESKNSIRDDLSWLGITPDWYSSQSELMPKIKILALYLAHAENKSKRNQKKAIKKILPKPSFADYSVAEATGFHHCYPPNLRLTSEHILMDFCENCSFIIRGNDLLDEDCLYDVKRKEWGLPEVRRHYLPRLEFEGDEISKTIGKFKLKSFRDKGIRPREVIDDLAIDCLIDPHKDWTVDNLKLRPALGSWAEGMIYAK